MERYVETLGYAETPELHELRDQWTTAAWRVIGAEAEGGDPDARLVARQLANRYREQSEAVIDAPTAPGPDQPQARLRRIIARDLMMGAVERELNPEGYKWDLLSARDLAEEAGYQDIIDAIDQELESMP
jgi:hypothetical protein